MNTTKWLGVAAAVVVVCLLAFWLTRPKNSTPTDQTQTSQQPAQTPTPTPTPTPPNGTVKLSSKTALGNFLVDSNGMTLYYFANDKINTSNCAAGPCLDFWPIYSQSNIAAQPPLLQTDFAQITRSDGVKQTTYKGWPVYYFIKDKQPGDTLGIGVMNTWYLFPDPFYTVMVENQDSVGGNYLIDPKGMTLYSFANDKQGSATTSPVSNCTGKCVTTWPVFSTSSVIAPSLLKNSDFSTFKRSDGANQLAYKGWPLYYYSSDTKSGDVMGQNFNKLWFVVKP
ncbi:MAG: hypothetical protein WDN47_04845 [Candidatus Doudnabacteria bacterium]